MLPGWDLFLAGDTVRGKAQLASGALVGFFYLFIFGQMTLLWVINQRRAV